MQSWLEMLLKRDRHVVIAALGLVLICSWVYLLNGAGMSMSAIEMTPNPMATPMAMPMMSLATWTPSYALVMFFMWWIMMIAMMLPSAAPMILLHALVSRKSRHRTSEVATPGSQSPLLMTTMFTLGYLIVWGVFSALATAAQWGLERTELLSAMMVNTSVVLGAGLLIAAGIWQLTPIKQSCLRHCRTPLQFISAHWRSGAYGALQMGIHHGAFCLGCCWFLMGLLFYGGIMNLYWIIGLALFVLLEKTIPSHTWFSRGTGIVLIAWGLGLFINFVVA